MYHVAMIASKIDFSNITPRTLSVRFPFLNPRTTRGQSINHMCIDEYSRNPQANPTTVPIRHKQMALPFTSRRSPVLCRNGCVSCSQPLAAEIGLQVLRRGGNAADAAVAVAAALNVTEPCSTGIGGDCFCLFYDASSKEVQGINGR